MDCPLHNPNRVGIKVPLGGSLIPNPVGWVGTTNILRKERGMEISVNTVVGLAEAKVAYWQGEVDQAALVLRTQAHELSPSAWEQALLLYNRCYRNLLAAQTTLDNLPKKGGVK